MPTITIPQSSPADVRRSESQGVLIIHGHPAGAEAVAGKSLLDAGALTIAGDYYCHIDTHDWSALEVHLMASAVTGSITPVLERMYANRQMVRSSTNGVAIVAGTAQTISTSAIVGTQRFRVKITVPGSGSVTFAPGTNPAALTALAEFNGT